MIGGGEEEDIGILDEILSVGIVGVNDILEVAGDGGRGVDGAYVRQEISCPIRKVAMDELA